MTTAAKNYVVQAYRRKGQTFDNHIFGLHVKFAPNDKGHVVATIPSDRQDVYDRLVNDIPEAYCVYEGKDTEEVVQRVLTSADTEPPTSPVNLFVIHTTAEDGSAITIDLKEMGDKELKEFVKTNGIKGVNTSLKGDPLRAAIFEAVSKAMGENGEDAKKIADANNQ